VAASQRWLWIGLAAVLAVVLVGALVRFLGSDERLPTSASGDPWGDRPAGAPAPAPRGPAYTTEVKVVPDQQDLKMAKGFLSVFGRIVDRSNARGSATGPPTEEDRALAKDTIGMFGEVLERASAAGSATGSAAGSDAWR
jgi:hypothetical protein